MSNKSKLFDHREEIMKVIKRNGQEVIFDPDKIRIAVTKANNSVDEIGKRLTPLQIDTVVKEVVHEC